MTRLLEGKVAIVTGGSRGIGAAAAGAFAEAGAAVVVAVRDAEALGAVAEGITEAGGKALAVPTDVGDPSEVELLVRKATDAYGRVDAAFNNAGGGGGQRPTPLADVAVEDFDSSVRVNLRGVFLCMKHEIPALIESGGGAIINMSSTGGLRGVPGVGAYVASKHAIIGLTRSAALDYSRHRIRVNAVAPGQVLTHRLAAVPEEHRARIAGAIPMQRIGSPEEVAAVVVWLCSDQASFITGETITVDGGKLATGA